MDDKLIEQAGADFNGFSEESADDLPFGHRHWIVELWFHGYKEPWMRAEIAETEIGWYVRPWYVGYFGRVDKDVGQKKFQGLTYAKDLDEVKSMLLEVFIKKFGYFEKHFEWKAVDRVGLSSWHVSDWNKNK